MDAKPLRKTPCINCRQQKVGRIIKLYCSHFYNIILQHSLTHLIRPDAMLIQHLANLVQGVLVWGGIV